MSGAGTGPAAVERMLAQAFDGLPASLAGPCRRLALAGGKRLRASLVLTVAGDAAAAVPAAAAVELLHLATLVHDDLLDDAPERRGVPTVHAAEGAGTAVLAGDVLIGLAGRYAARAGVHAAALASDALVDLCAGQALEAAHRHDPGVTATTALRIAELKTGTLIATACELGAAAAGRNSDGLRAYGLAFGIVLQLLDDLLDLLSDDETYGKPTAADFAAGTVTLPAVHTLAAEPRLRDLLRPGLTAAERDTATRLLRRGPGIAETLRTIDELVDQATRFRPDLADLPRAYAERQLRLISPRHRGLIPEKNPARR
ncbi:polyprenyl synthetase family protein [Nucisporomicrobium flavum]|uniref:polyprenyl synthetase family protein n=1 Tax=Nucisporomicrobium flavum TaxID=2785915 RepID=UPI0018F66244|nr:polyprenyl synthetase family protein [Nucisporomicrobium flavum]